METDWNNWPIVAVIAVCLTIVMHVLKLRGLLYFLGLFAQAVGDVLTFVGEELVMWDECAVYRISYVSSKVPPTCEAVGCGRQAGCGLRKQRAEGWRLDFGVMVLCPLHNTKGRTVGAQVLHMPEVKEPRA